MKAINRYIIVDRIKTEPKKVAGLIMTDDTDVDNRYIKAKIISCGNCLLYTSPSPRDGLLSRMPSSA